MKVVNLSDSVAWVAEQDLMRQRAFDDYNSLREARDAEIRREYGFAVAKRESLAEDRNAAIEREYAREKEEYELKRPGYERQAASRNAAIEREYARALSEYERRTADRNAFMEREYARALSKYERRTADRNAAIEKETRTQNRLFRRRLGWLPMWAAALATVAIVAFYLYSAIESLESLTILYDGALSDGYAFRYVMSAFRYVMSAFRYSDWIAASSAIGGVILILAFWRLKLRLSSERPEHEPPFGNPLALPQSSRLPLVALCLLLAVLVCVNAYIRSVAFIPEHLYGLGVVSFVFGISAIIMFATIFAWMAVPFWMRRSRRSIASGIPESSPPSRDKISERCPKPPVRPNMDEIARRYPKPPSPPNMDEIARRCPKPTIRPNMDEIAKRHPEPPLPGGLDLVWRARAERERKLDEVLDSQLPSHWTSITRLSRSRRRRRSHNRKSAWSLRACRRACRGESVRERSQLETPKVQ